MWLNNSRHKPAVIGNLDKNQRRNERRKAMLLLLLLSAGISPDCYTYKQIRILKRGRYPEYVSLDVLFYLHGNTDKFTGKTWDREHDRKTMIEKFEDKH